MRNAFALLIVFGIFLAGCGGNKEQLDELEKKNYDLTQQLASRDRSIEDITATMNEIHTKLNSALAKQKVAVRDSSSTRSLTLMELEQNVRAQVGEVSATLKDIRVRVSRLDQKVKSLGSENTNLQQKIDELKKALEQREKAIAEFEARIQKLDADLKQKDQVIAMRDATIEDQKRQLNTVYYVTGKQSTLKEQGVITSEGGFLWGLLGATKVLASNYNDTKFVALDKRSESTIDVPGKIDEMVPGRDISSYTVEPGANGHTTLKIVKPETFWKQNHLAIVIE